MTTDTLSLVTDTLAQPLVLPNGAKVKNRFLKSAMSEILGTVNHAPSPGLARLYGTWADGGLGLSISGNVMIDRRALGEPRNVVIEDDRDLAALKGWAEAGARNGSQLWMQLNHPGKQSPGFLSSETVAPSAIPFESELRHIFPTPRALSDVEILDLIERYGKAAGIAVAAGFGGIQIHGAHGYLVSQFLSPKHNQRTDRWGGSLENRMRFAIEVYRAIRRNVGATIPVGIKINSADFQRGGFSEEDSLTVIRTLAEEQMDLIEISGGNYESPTMTGARVRKSTLEREAYFLDFASRVRTETNVPLAVTGGFRTANGMAEAIASGAIDMVGLARPLAVDPDLPRTHSRNRQLYQPRQTTIDRFQSCRSLLHARGHLV